MKRYTTNNRIEDLYTVEKYAKNLTENRLYIIEMIKDKCEDVIEDFTPQSQSHKNAQEVLALINEVLAPTEEVTESIEAVQNHLNLTVERFNKYAEYRKQNNLITDVEIQEFFLNHSTLKNASVYAEQRGVYIETDYKNICVEYEEILNYINKIVGNYDNIIIEEVTAVNGYKAIRVKVKFNSSNYGRYELRFNR